MPETRVKAKNDTGQPNRAQRTASEIPLAPFLVSGSCVITSQYPLSDWHLRMDDPTLADAICDRFVHNSYKIELKGESIRKTRKKKGEPQP